MYQSPIRRVIRRSRSPVRHSQMTRRYQSPVRRSLSQMYSGYVYEWNDDDIYNLRNPTSCKPISSSEFDDLDSLGVHEFDRNRCYDPDYDLNPNNEGDRGAYVRWAILNSHLLLLMPDKDNKFPYLDIEFAAMVENYLTELGNNTPVGSTKYYESVLNKLETKRLELFNNPETPLQKKVASILAKYESKMDKAIARYSVNSRSDRTSQDYILSRSVKPCSDVKKSADLTGLPFHACANDRTTHTFDLAKSDKTVSDQDKITILNKYPKEVRDKKIRQFFDHKI